LTGNIVGKQRKGGFGQKPAHGDTQEIGLRNHVDSNKKKRDGLAPFNGELLGKRNCAYFSL